MGSELGFYRLWSEEFGFSVTIDNSANIALTLSKHHVNQTCGLCGNFNTITADEYMAQEGEQKKIQLCAQCTCLRLRVCDLVESRKYF